MPGMVAGERLAQPPPPENCTIREESRTTVRVSCAESEYIDPRTATYVLQVFDADTRRLLASATSMTPSMLEITDLPAERSYSGLVLSLRIMTEHAMSDATVLHSPHFVQEGKTQEHQRYPGRGQLVFDFESACAIRGPHINSVQNTEPEHDRGPDRPYILIDLSFSIGQLLFFLSLPCFFFLFFNSPADCNLFH